ncbi:uncharacterized protein LOC122257948 [Penaeus japonicus]|uniref:uncharacterized protein LOC122257948 n=1 Tax=Penaeus japonicus TaxID=27405 RepID=UPI001C70F5C8|nr:uncharacterized protein LOC122257948 [Penaeus japonicus]
MHGPLSMKLGLALAVLGAASAYNPIFRENDMARWKDSFLFNEPQREPLVKYYDLSYLSFEQQDLLKTVADVEALANLTGLPLLDDDPRDPSAGLRIGFRSLSPPVRSRRRRQYESLPQCKPRTVVEPIEQHFDGVRAIPTCIERRICGGCCSAGRLCVATKTKTLTKKVIHLIGTYGVAPVLLNVTDDEECQCICKIKASDCINLERQEYDPDNCVCRCKSSLADEKTLCESLGHYWDYNNCTCVCRSIASRECSSGYTFNEFTCGCVPI